MHRQAAVGEAHYVTIPAGACVLSSAWLSSVLEGSPEWPHGAVRVLNTRRIGTEHGLSGEIHRVATETTLGGPRSVVVKQEAAAAVRRELLFRSHCGELMRAQIPDLLCGVTDAERGVLVLEDVDPAEQGDVLDGCTDGQAEAVMRALARLHAGSWHPTANAESADLPRWRAHAMEPDRWRVRLVRAGERFPEILAQHIAALHDLPTRVADAGNTLGHGPVAWLQVDTHLDNILFRPDGSVVLLDWCNAALGPPIVDLARFLTEGVVPPSRPERVTALVSLYAEELGRLGVDAVSRAELRSSFELALLPLLQGVVGWAGREDLEAGGRPAALCESFLRSLCGWALGDGSPAQKGHTAL